VREVAAPLECGIGVEGFSDFKAGDVLEVFELEEIKQTID
jgi:translation initiation factor IF-2